MSAVRPAKSRPEPRPKSRSLRAKVTRILAIESSCDESAAAYLEVRAGVATRIESVVATQAIHAKYGGVVPEVAAREHSATLPLVLDELARKVLGGSGRGAGGHGASGNGAGGQALGCVIDVVAATTGPGLVTSLKVGADTGRALAAAWGKRFVGVNHIDGHVSASWLPGAPLAAPQLERSDAALAARDATTGKRGRRVADAGVFPALVLVVSGGHTELLLMRGHGKYTLLGATRDDAAGEAFDKSAKLMGLGYPGGPAISRLATQGNPSAFDFPRPMLSNPHLDFSFSGLKTSVRYFLDREQARLSDPSFVADVAASVEQAIVDVLVGKTVRAAVATKVRTVILAGGVAANPKLRATLRERLLAKAPNVTFVEPPLAYCTDNAAMIAMAAYFASESGRRTDWRTADVDAGWELGRVRGTVANAHLASRARPPASSARLRASSHRKPARS